MSHALADARMTPTVRGEAITKDGIRVLTEASGPGTSMFERRRAARNLSRWNRGLRPNRYGIWRKP